MKRTLQSIVKTIALAGTPESLSSSSNQSTFIKIRALASNTGNVYIGDANSQEFPLAAGEELPLSEIMTSSGGCDELNLSEIYIDADTNGEGVAILIAK